MSYVVYILTNKPNGVLYVGITNDLKRRITEHKLGIINGFSEKYNLSMLIYFEQFQYVKDAIYREKRLKRWPRQWKINLINEFNIEWKDKYVDFFGPTDQEYFDYILNYHLTLKKGLDPRLNRG